MEITELPNVMLIQIFELLSYEEVSKCRMVCRQFDQVGQKVLNFGFNKASRLHSRSFKRIKALLPRRESERRNHCLARHADILTSVETRLSMLSMTYTKYMDMNLCCFIPGRVLDEIFRILRIIARTQKPLRPHEVLQELRDISSMAIEHFDEKIAQNFRVAGTYNPNANKRIPNYSTSIVSRPWTTVQGVQSFEFTTTEVMQQRVNNYLQTGFLESNIISPHMSLPSSSQQQQPMFYRTNGETVPIVDYLNEKRVGDDSKKKTGGDCNRHCPSAKKCKKLAAAFKQGVNRMRKMKSTQFNEARRLQLAFKTISELTGQIADLRKRIEDLDTKNREISANIKQIKVGETPAVLGNDIGGSGGVGVSLSTYASQATSVPLLSVSPTSHTAPAGSTDHKRPLKRVALKKRNQTDERDNVLDITLLAAASLDECEIAHTSAKIKKI